MNMNILIIEDVDLTTQILESRIKRSNSKFNVKSFKTVARALSVEEFIPDIIILDHLLPGVKGIDALPVIKEKFPKAKIIVYSGQKDIELFSESINAGADLYIQKNEDSVVKLMGVIEEENLVGKKDSYIDRMFEKLDNMFTSKPVRKQKVVFLVEDDELFSFAIQKKLNDTLNCKIYTYDTANDCIANFDKKPDVIIADYYLSEGQTVIEIAKAYENDPFNTDFIVYSSQKDVKVAEQLLEYGISKYYVKNQETANNIVENL